jgi:hypothetical protein
MPYRFPVTRDAFERLVRTFLQAVLAAGITDGLDWQNLLSLDTWKTYALAGVAAVLSAVMSWLATLVGKVGGAATSASFDPEVKLQPVDGAAPLPGDPVV